MKHFLFDLDGTIGNTLPLCIAAFQEALQSLAGRPFTEEEIFATFGPCEEGTVAALLPEHRTAGVEQYLRSYERLHPRWPKPFDGMLELLQTLRAHGAFLGLVTGKAERSAVVTLRWYGLQDFFEVTKWGDPSGPVKDRRIEEIIEEFALPREEILYVGDSPLDILASRKCRIQVAAAAWAPTADVAALRREQPDFLFTSVPEFAAFATKRLADEPLGSQD